MATGGDRFSDPEYINWLRATLALMYMKEGLEEFTNSQADIFHKKLLKSFGTTIQTCKGQCSSIDIKKDFRNRIWNMSCSVCDTWLQSVISFHRNYPFPNMSPENTHPKLWQTESWETMKLFVPFGCETDMSARDADIQGILSLFINCRHFSTGVNIGRQDLLDKLLGIRNSLFHSANFKVSERDVKNHFQTVLAFMQGMKGLTGSEKERLKAAIEKIQQLEANQIEISLNKELELRALKEGHIALDRDLRALVDVTQKEQDKQSTEVKQHASTLKELQETKDRFENFLKENDLDQNMGRISTVLQQHGKRLEQQYVISHDLNQRIDQQDAKTHDLNQRIAQQDVKTHDLHQRIDQQAVKIHSLEEQMTLKVDTVTDSLSFDDQCKVLQQHLLHMYGKRKFWENPVSSEEEFLSQMYVQPAVKFIREIDDRGMLTEVKQQGFMSSKLTYEMVFLSKIGPCENIYLTGDAGKGKTTFCNQLFLQWCKALQHTVPCEDLKELASFRFLFHIDLRDTGTIYHVEDMIQEQLLFNVQVALNLSQIMKTERCLIVLDGLDEWACPDNVKKCPDINKHIPGRNTAYKNCVFLTTTRPWKNDVIALKNKDVDKCIELSGIDDESSKELAQKILDNLYKKSKTRKNCYDFFKDVRTKNLNEFLTVPVLLIQLLTLWHAGKDFGNSQLQLYCNMLELLFERSEKNLTEEISKCLNSTIVKPRKLPECFSTKDNCQKYAELLRCLAKLAYKALFNKQKEEALVFKSSSLDIFGISPSDIKLCLHCGILSQSKDYGNYTGKYKKLSFLHKKVQECLAALYLVSNNTVEDLLKEVKQLCYAVETMLEMNQVWLFVAGMEPDMTRRLFEHLGNVVSGDGRVKTYRHTIGGGRFSDSGRLIDRIQSCVFDCLLEGINNGHHYENICLEDFIIYSSNVRDVECVLSCCCMSNVKSVYVWTHGIDAAKMIAIIGQFQQCRSLQKLYLNESWSFLIPDSTVTALVKNNYDSLTSLELLIQITATDKLVTDICSSISKSLMALRLYKVKLTHGHIEQILHSLSQSPIIRHLDLSLHCTDHCGWCSVGIDLSSMVQLQKLALSSMHVNNLQFLPHCLEKVKLERVTLPVTSLRDFARVLSQTKRKITLQLYWVTFTETREECGDLKGFLRSCPGLEQTECKYVDWCDRWWIDVGV